MSVQIISSMPGSGKSTWAFRYMNKHSDELWMYVSPYLDEVGDGKSPKRIHKECESLDFASPSDRGQNKSDHLLALLQEGRNVAITHSLFNRLTIDHVVHIKSKGYSLIIDEALDSINLLDVTTELKQDLAALMATGFINRNQDDSLSWAEDKPCLSPYVDIKEHCDKHELYLYQNEIYIKRSNTKAIEGAKQVFVMTYLFESSYMRCWLDINKIDYHYYTPKEILPEDTLKQQLRDNIMVADVPRKIIKFQQSLDKPNSAFNVTAYKKMKPDDFKQVKRSMESAVRQYRDHPHLQGEKVDVLWTTFSKYRDKLEGAGYTRGKGGDVEDAPEPFAAKNTRASNKYKDKNLILYVVNIFPHKNISQYLKSLKVEIDVDMVALAECIQFVYRSCLRDNKPAILVFFSERMRKIFLEWLEQ